MTVPAETGSISENITLADTRSPEEIVNDAAVELVKRDAETATAWIEGQQWNENWRVIDILYDSPRQFATFEGGQTQKAIAQRYILCQHVNSIHPKFVDGLFYDDQMFTAKPVAGTAADTMRARCEVIRTQLKNMRFEDEVGQGAFQLILHGTAIWKWGLRTEEEVFYEYERSAEPITTTDLQGNTSQIQTRESSTWKEIEKKRVVIKPFFDNVEIRDVLVDPKLKWPDIQRAKYVIHKYYLNLADMLELKNDPNYDLPDEETLKTWIVEPRDKAVALGRQDPTQGAPTIAGQGEPDWEDTSDDPYQDCLMFLERWDQYKVITTIQNRKCIQNRKNDYACIPFYSSNFYNRIRSFWGIGTGKIVGTDQRLQQGLEGGAVSLLQILLDPPFAINTEQYVMTQNVRMRKGQAIKVKGDVRTAIQPIEMPKLPLAEVLAFLQNSQTKAEAADGMNEMFTAGAMPGPGTSGRSSATRNATGVSAIAGANASRLEGPLGRFCNQVFIPWIYQLDLLNRRFLMTTPEGHDWIKTVLGEQMAKDYKFDAGEFLSGRVEFDVLAGTKLKAKSLVGQALPIMWSLFEQPQVIEQLAKYSGEIPSLKEFINLFMEAIGWPTSTKSLFMPVPQDMLQQIRQGEQASKAQQQAQLEQQRFQNQSSLLEQKGQQGIARDVVKETVKAAGQPKPGVDEKATNQGEDYLLRQAFETAPETLGGMQ